MKARLVLIHCFFTVSVILSLNVAALSTAYAPGSAFARIVGIMAQGEGEAPGAMPRARRAIVLLENKDFRPRLGRTLNAYGLGDRYKMFILEMLQTLRDGREGEFGQTLNDLHPEAVLELAEFIARQHRGAIREREHEFLGRISALEKVISENGALTDYRAAFVEYYRDQYLGAFLNDIYRDVLFSPRRGAVGWSEKVLAEFLSTYRDKLHVLVNASNTELYQIFQLELVAAIEGRSATGGKCRQSGLLWAGRTLAPRTPMAWQRDSYSNATYQWTAHDYRSEVRKLDILMSVKQRAPDRQREELESFHSRFETIKYREERVVRKKLGVPYKYEFSGYSTDWSDYPFKPHLHFPESWKVRENYCELLYIALAYRHNLEKRDLLLYTREMLKRRMDAIRQWPERHT